MPSTDFEAALTSPSVFEDRQKVSFEYVPEELPHRDEQLVTLAKAFRGVYEGTTGAQFTIRGPVGSGKTVIAHRFARDFREALRKKGGKLDIAYVNCRNDRTDATALTRIAQSLDPRFPDRGFKFEEVRDAIEKRIVTRESHLLVILDEVDSLLSMSKHDGDGSNLLYALSRFNSNKSRPLLSVLAVAQRDFFPLLDEATRSTFPITQTMVLDPYDFEGLKAIVDQRVKLAFKPGRVRPRVAELVADIAAEKGDARRAIEVLRKAGENADDEGHEEVTPEDVRTAKAFIHSELPEHKLQELPLHEALTLLAISRRLARSGEPFAITGEAEQTYALVCEEYGESPRKHTQFWSYLKNLDAYGFITLRPSGRGQAGKTQEISLPDIPAKRFAPQLEALLRDQHGMQA